MKGFTLIEVLVSLFILAILSLSAVNLFTKHQAGLEPAFELYQDLHLAQSEAIARQRPVTLCPTDDSHQCINQWTKHYTIFFTQDGKTIPVKHHTLNCDRLIGQTTLNQPITFSPAGHCLQQGTLTVYKNKSFTQLIFLRSGRVRMTSGTST